MSGINQPSRRRKRNDILGRLRLAPSDIGGPSQIEMERERIEAADEIQRLRARAAELEQANAELRATEQAWQVIILDEVRAAALAGRPGSIVKAVAALRARAEAAERRIAEAPVVEVWMHATIGGQSESTYRVIREAATGLVPIGKFVALVEVE